MSESKYNKLKTMVTNLSKEYPQEETLKSILEAMELLDSQEEKEEELITVEEFNKMSYKERAKLKNEKPEVYNNAIAGKFKEAN